MAPNQAAFFDTGLLFILVLGALIAVHEFGHFIIAKLAGVFVERFSIGFGPPLWKKQVGETEYRLAAIPLGGYVKMFGEQLDEEVAESEAARSFQHQSVWKRIAIVLAGPGFNFLFAIALIAFIHVVGVPIETSVQIGRVLEHSAAAQAGLQTDDMVVSLNGQSIQRIDELKKRIVSSEGNTLQLEVRRAEHLLTLPLTPKKDERAGEWRIGVELRPGDITLQRVGPLAALMQGCAWTWQITRLISAGFAQIISGAMPISESLAGPLGVAREIGRQADHGWRNVVFFTAGISINLAILNLLPIPVLDGGHLFFFVIELVKGSPLSLRKREIAQQVGLLIVVSLMVFAFYNDIMRMFFL